MSSSGGDRASSSNGCGASAGNSGSKNGVGRGSGSLTGPGSFTSGSRSTRPLSHSRAHSPHPRAGNLTHRAPETLEGRERRRDPPRDLPSQQRTGVQSWGDRGPFRGETAPDKVDSGRNGSTRPAARGRDTPCRRERVKVRGEEGRTTEKIFI